MLEGMHMRELKLVAAQAFQPIIGAADLPITHLERMAERAGLPGRIIENTTGVVPLHSTENFLEMVHRKVGDPSFLFNSLGLDANEKQQTHSVAGIPLPLGVTGKEALQGMTNTFNSYITGAKFSCELRDGLLWVERSASATEWSNYWSVLQYNISIMLFGARRILGQNLQLVALHLPSVHIGKNVPEQLANIPVIHKQEKFGIAFNLSDVVDKGFALKQSGKPLVDPDADPLTENMRDAFASCLSMFLTSSTTDGLSDRVARALGLSTRSYRRQLAGIGISHSKILADVRLDLAFKFFKDDTMSLTDISVELGYAHPGDFTRFFKNRMGCSPIEYRERRLQLVPTL
jgi:AraC-like DNA-binding protein